MSTENPSLKNEGAPNLDAICRLCLTEDTGRINIFESGQLSLPVRIMACAALEVQSSDGLPQLMCDPCRLQLEKSYYFRKKCQAADAKLRKHIRLINAGKKSRVFLKPTDEENEDELQLEESAKFIDEQEAQKLKEDNEEREKWMAEQLEQFRKEETQRLFEEFGNFVNSRRTNEITVTRKTTESVEFEINLQQPKSQSQSYKQKLEVVDESANESNTKTIHLDSVEQAASFEADNEITSSEQVPDHQEQEYVYSDDEADNSDGNIQTFIIYGKDDDGNHGQVIEIESERLDELENDLNQSDEEDGAEGSIELSVNNEERNEELIYTHEFVDSDNRGDDNMNVVQSYQLEENGEVQYLKDDENPETLSVSDDDSDDVKFILSNAEVSEYQVEDEEHIVETPPKNTMKRKAAESTNAGSEAKKPNIIVSSSLKDCYAKISTEDLKIFKCSECPQSFTRENSLHRHWAAHRKGRQYACSHCEKCFSCKSSLDRHMRVHTGEKPFTCEECGKSYMQKEVLNRHLSIHSGKRPHPCPHCPRAFVQKLMLTQHINATHSEAPQFQKHDCHLCSKSFNYASGLSRHLLTHSGMKFRCVECGRPFNDKSAIRRHILAVHAKTNQKNPIQVIISSTKEDQSIEYTV